MEKNIGKIKEHNIRIMDRRSSIAIKDLEIRSFNIPHDAIAPEDTLYLLVEKMQA